MNRIYFLISFVVVLSGCRIYTDIEGQGRVTSSNGHFNCATGQSGDCEQSYTTSGSEKLQATPDPGQVFTRWSNCTYDTLDTCTLSWNQSLAEEGGTWRVSAIFKEASAPVRAARYTYNAHGQRVTKTVDGHTLIFQYDLQGNLMAEIDAATQQPVRQHIYINREPVAQLSTDPLNGSLSVQYIHADHRGAPVLLTDARARVVADIAATPFGEATIDYAQVQHHRRFSGQYKDEETGLHYNYFRDYDPSLGRYLQSDPIGLYGGFNTYGFAYQNPVMNIDPYGLLTIGEANAIGSTIGGAIGGAVNGALTGVSAGAGGVVAGTIVGGAQGAAVGALAGAARATLGTGGPTLTGLATGGWVGGGSALAGETIGLLMPGPGASITGGAVGGALGGASGGAASAIGAALGGAIGGALAAALCYGDTECYAEIKQRERGCP